MHISFIGGFFRMGLFLVSKHVFTVQLSPFPFWANLIKLLCVRISEMGISIVGWYKWKSWEYAWKFHYHWRRFPSFLTWFHTYPAHVLIQSKLNSLPVHVLAAFHFTTHSLFYSFFGTRRICKSDQIICLGLICFRQQYCFEALPFSILIDRSLNTAYKVV